MYGMNRISEDIEIAVSAWAQPCIVYIVVWMRQTKSIWGIYFFCTKFYQTLTPLNYNNNNNNPIQAPATHKDPATVTGLSYPPRVTGGKLSLRFTLARLTPGKPSLGVTAAWYTTTIPSPALLIKEETAAI